MRKRILGSRQTRAVALGACLAGSIGLLTFALQTHVAAEDNDAAPKSQDQKPEATRKKKHRTAKAAARPAEGASKTPAAASAANPAAPKVEGQKSAPIDFAARLDMAGTTPCRAQINALADSTMGGVEQFNTVANYSQVGADKRAVSVAIGQKYSDKSPVPFGVSQVISAPNQAGSCDGFTVQVFPSPLSCAKLRDSILAGKGRQIGDLVGMPLMQDPGGRTLLVPASANTCVLVATRVFYAK